MIAEILKGCSFCSRLPKLSSRSSYRTQYNYSCCRIGRTADSEEEAAHWWNQSNLSSDKTYRKNNLTKQWELLENAISQ